MSATAVAQKIRKALRRNWGVTGRQVSVKADNARRLVRVVIKKPGFSSKAIRMVCNKVVSDANHLERSAARFFPPQIQAAVVDHDPDRFDQTENELCQWLLGIRPGTGVAFLPGMTVYRISDEVGALLNYTINYGNGPKMTTAGSGAFSLATILCESVEDPVGLAKAIRSGLVVKRIETVEAK